MAASSWPTHISTDLTSVVTLVGANTTTCCQTAQSMHSITHHTSLDDTGLDTANGNCPDTTNLVHILERETKRLVGGTRRRLNGVDGLKEGLALGGTSLGLLGPSLVPRHAAG